MMLKDARFILTLASQSNQLLIIIYYQLTNETFNRNSTRQNFILGILETFLFFHFCILVISRDMRVHIRIQTYLEGYFTSLYYKCNQVASVSEHGGLIVAEGFNARLGNMKEYSFSLINELGEQFVPFPE